MHYLYHIMDEEVLHYLDNKKKVDVDILKVCNISRSLNICDGKYFILSIFIYIHQSLSPTVYGVESISSTDIQCIGYAVFTQ